MLTKLTTLPLLLVALASIGVSQILYSTHQGVGSGVLNGVPFASTPFTIACEWEVGAVRPGVGGYVVDHTSASIDISGVGTFTIITPTRSYCHLGLAMTGFSRASGPDLVNGPSDPSLAGWNLSSPIGPLVGTATILQWWISGGVSTSGGILELDDASGVPCTFVAAFTPPTIGSSYCGPAVINSTGQSGAIEAAGSVFVANNTLTLVASNLPLNSFGYFLTSMTRDHLPNAGGSQGVLCLGGSIGRYIGPGQVKNTGAAGSFELLLDLNQTPTPTGLVAVAAGETWNFQTWHRDSVSGVATSNFTDGLEIVFQ